MPAAWVEAWRVRPSSLLRDVEGALDHRIAVALGLQLRLALDRLRQRHRRGRILRHQLAQLVDLPVRHLQHAADVAQHAARLQRAEGDDLRHLVAAVALLHVADHFVAAVLAEVDVEVRHRHALGIEEALEQQTEADRIEIGDGQRVGHQRAGARAAAGADRNAFRFRPLDEVGDDQEVAGIFHAGDDAELEVEPLAVFLLRCGPGATPALASRRARPASARLRSSLASSTTLPPSPTEKRGRIGACVCGRKAQRSRDLDGRGQRLRQIGEQRRHLGAALEAMLGIELAAVAFRQHAAFGDADQRVMRLVVGAVGEIRLVGRDQRDAFAVSEIDQHRLGHALVRRAVALQFDIEPVAEQAVPARRAAWWRDGFGRRRWRHRAGRPARR